MLKRSGSVTRYHVEGSLPPPHEPAFAEKLAARRFRSIENAASEEVSYGWVTPADPTGNSFDAEDFAYEDGAWLKLRIDKKKLPAAWLQIHRMAAEKAAGRQLNVRERRELKEGLLEQLLPRVLPSVAMIDLLWFPARKIALVFSTSTAVRDVFDKLFRETFDALPEAADAFELATSLELSDPQMRFLDQVRPVRWLKDDAARTSLRVVAANDDADQPSHAAIVDSEPIEVIVDTPDGGES